MPRTRITLTLDNDVIRAVEIRAARSGRNVSDVIEESLRRDLRLDALDRLWAQGKPAPEAEGIALADAELHAMRKEHR